MKKQLRHRAILQALEQAQDGRIVSTRELADHLGVSEMTIRRDLHELAQKGLVQRQHGGATLPRYPTAPSAHRGEIGILLTSRLAKYTDPFFNEVLQGADRKLQELGYRTAFVFSFSDIHTVEQARRLLQDYPDAGILLIGTWKAPSIDYLKENVNVLVSTVGSIGPEHDAVLMDGYSGIRAIVNHLAGLGRQRLAFITGYYDSRERGFVEGVQANNLPDDKDLRIAIEGGFDGWTPQIGHKATSILMNRKTPPDAIVCASDRLAIGAMQWLHQNGYRVPADVAVTGFDNIPGSEFTIPPLTTVHVHKQLIGALAAERAIRRLENPSEIPLQIRTPTSILIRQSCGATPALASANEEQNTRKRSMG